MTLPSLEILNITGTHLNPGIYWEGGNNDGKILSIANLAHKIHHLIMTNTYKGRVNSPIDLFLCLFWSEATITQLMSFCVSVLPEFKEIFDESNVHTLNGI